MEKVSNKKIKIVKRYWNNFFVEESFWDLLVITTRNEFKNKIFDI